MTPIEVTIEDWLNVFSTPPITISTFIFIIGGIVAIKSDKRYKDVRVGVVFFILVCVMWVFNLRQFAIGRSWSRVYNEGLAYEESGDYITAYSIYTNIPSVYEPAKTRAEQIRRQVLYQQAELYFEGEEYEKAFALYREILDFDDSAERANQILEILDKEWGEILE